MQSKPSIALDDSPVPGVIPAAVHLDDDALAAPDRARAAATTSEPTRPPQTPGRRSRASAPLAKLLSVIRGDKYMVDAYPPAWRAPGAARAGATPPSEGHDGEAAAGLQTAAGGARSAGGHAAGEGS